MSFIDTLTDIFKVKEYKEQISRLQSEITQLEIKNVNLQNKLQDLGYDSYIAVKTQVNLLNVKILDQQKQITSLQDQTAKYNTENEKAKKEYEASLRKANKLKELYRAVEYSLNAWKLGEQISSLNIEQQVLFDELLPTVTLKLHCQDMKDLRKAYRENEKAIDKVVEAYRGRYTTKANRSIYELMVIALRAEIQNILYSLKYEKLDDGIESIKKVTAKYLEITSEGNQSIAPTIKKFIYEIEYLFINAAKIEYNYYVKKEQARQEQIALREQMRQEAEERKALEKERKRIESEEQKYLDQIAALKERLESELENKAALEAEILKIESNLSDVVLKKDEISKLEHGKAGFIYIISNLGSFGDNMFKIGMTRRSDPQDRVDELGDASVPFKYDVHSFIFSEDAVSLETELHHRLDAKRVNKVNLRKEFFYATIDELEELTNEISPAAEFNRTMLAEEYRQSLSADGNYTTDYSPEEFEEE